MLDVSIVIVSWNAKDVLSKCLQSIENDKSKYTREVIVVDNASTDGSAELVKENFKDVKLIENTENLGFSKANNIGLKQTTGRYVYLLNSDVEILGENIEPLCTYMDGHPDVAVLGPRVLNPNKSIRTNCKKFPTLWNSFCKATALFKIFPKSNFFSDDFIRNFGYDTILEVEVLPGCCLMIRRDVLFDVGLLDEKFYIYSEDKDLCKTISKAGWKIVFFPDTDVIHYAGSSSENAPVRFLKEMIKANIIYWQKHHNKISQFVFINIMVLHYFFRVIGSIIGSIFISTPKENIKSNCASLKFLITDVLFNFRKL